MNYLALFLVFQFATVTPQIHETGAVNQAVSLDPSLGAIAKGSALVDPGTNLPKPSLANSLSDTTSETTRIAQAQEASSLAVDWGKEASILNNQPLLAEGFLQSFKQKVVDSSTLILGNISRVWQAVSDRYQGVTNQEVQEQAATLPPIPPSVPEVPPLRQKQLVISPDVDQLHLAAIEFLEREPELDPDSFRPNVGAQFNDDGSLILRVLVGNTHDHLTLVGDFNNWGEDDQGLQAYELWPTASNPHIHEVVLPPGNYHAQQYRLRDQYGNQRLDMGATLFSTPAFNERFYGHRDNNNLNSVFWKSAPLPAETYAERPDLRGKQLAIAETDVVSLSLKWTCQSPHSEFYGQTGADNITRLYQFIGECGLPERMAELGYNAVEFMPLDTHVDFWEPGAPYFPDWRYSYQTINFYGKHADFGSPDELKAMVNAFHQAKLAVILDVVYSHYSNEGNEGSRQFGPLGFAQYKREDGWELYGGPETEWGTRRFSYTPEVRQNLVDAGLIDILHYGFDGLRVDNVNGIDAQPDGRTLLRELSNTVMRYRPQAVVIGEGYFGDPHLNRSLDAGGAGLTTTYSDRFYLWFTEDLMKHRQEIDTWYVDYMLNNDWSRVLLYYPGNHDEFANPGNPFQARGRYLAEAIQGGDFHNRKIQSWSALTLFASSYYLDMPQLWTLQPGNLNSNAAIDWSREEKENVAQLLEFQSDMKHFYLNDEAFAPQNIHRHILHWVDHENKIFVFERIDFSTGRRTYAVVNLGDQPFEHYKIPVAPEDATFHIALDSDRPTYGGQNNNPTYIQADNHEVEFYLGAYGVLGLVQEDKIEPILLDGSDIMTPDYEQTEDYFFKALP